MPAEYQNRLDTYCQEINSGMDFTESFEKLSPDLLVTKLSEKTATKTVINTIIGKLGQRPAFPCVEMVSDSEKLDAMFANDKITIQSTFHINETTLQVNYQEREAFVQDSRKNSPILNALITAKSRIFLDQNIRKLQSKAIDILYCDTDR